MMMVTRIAAVSYLNTIPFIHGIEHGRTDLRPGLLLSPPAGCAEALRAGKADIALLPSGVLPAFSDIDIITPYCIGANGPVRTVVLASNGPVEGIRRIALDSHSLTSVRLVRMLARERWAIDPIWEELTDYSLPNREDPTQGYLLIGDKVFGQEGRFNYSYDLSAEWSAMTGLPFAFALWVARRGTPPEVVDALEGALRYGVARIPEAVERYGYSDRNYAVGYLENNIDFNLDADKRKALELYWQKASEADPPAEPG